jgi:membrane fusion protein, multidrug efflux system
MDGARDNPGLAKTLPATKPPRRGWGGAVIAVVIVVALGWVGWHYGWPKLQSMLGLNSSASGGRGNQAPPQPVGVATIGRGDVKIVLSALGTVTPLATVTVKTQISGQLVQIAFQEGQLVHKGDFLAQIDPRPYQVALEQAQAQLARDQATLKGAEVDLARYRTLVAQDSIATQTLDTQVALVATDQGTVQTDQASIDSAKLNLVYCHITASANGRVGLRQVDEGNYVQPTDANGIVVITQLQPISAIFSLPEDDIPQVLKQMHAGSTLSVVARDRADAVTIANGALSTIDNQVDTTTGTVKLRALFPNDDEQLFPSQFVNAHLLVDTLKNVIEAPTAAIQRGEPGTFVFVVGDDGLVHVVPITIGPQDGNMVAVTKGLNGGERVVVDGADRLRDGAKVTVPVPAGGQDGGGARRQHSEGGGGQHRHEHNQPQDGGQPAPAQAPAQAPSN